MARKRAMSAMEVDAIRKVGMTCVSNNLYLQIRDQGTRTWLFRYWVNNKQVYGRRRTGLHKVQASLTLSRLHCRTTMAGAGSGNRTRAFSLGS